MTESELCKKKENVELGAYFAYWLCIGMEPFILMDPYSFDAELPKIWNYAIHSVLSHELGHGFDPLAIYQAGIGEYDSINGGVFFSSLHYGEVVIEKCHFYFLTNLVVLKFLRIKNKKKFKASLRQTWFLIALQVTGLT